MRKLAVAAFIVLACAAITGNALAGTDPGTRDSVWIDNVTWDGTSPFTTKLYAETDSPLEHATIILTWSSTDIGIDSVSLAGSRWANQVDGDSGVFVATEGMIGGVLSPVHYNISFLPFGTLLPTGTGEVGTIYWSRKGGSVVETVYDVDTSTTSAGGSVETSTLFGTSALPDDSYVPAFASATITVEACSCPYQADFDASGFRDALDLGTMIDILFAGTPEPQDPYCPTGRADFDCDGFATALDLGALIDHLFAGADGPCNPCAK